MTLANGWLTIIISMVVKTGSAYWCMLTIPLSHGVVTIRRNYTMDVGESGLVRWE